MTSEITKWESETGCPLCTRDKLLALTNGSWEFTLAVFVVKHIEYCMGLLRGISHKYDPSLFEILVSAYFYTRICPNFPFQNNWWGVQLSEKWPFYREKKDESSWETRHPNTAVECPQHEESQMANCFQSWYSSKHCPLGAMFSTLKFHSMKPFA